MLHTDSIAEIFSMQMVESNSPPTPLLELSANMELELAILLNSFSSLFSTPTSLPPPRTHDHTISLVEGSGPSNKIIV